MSDTTADRMASRLHALIFRFNRPTLALLANGSDSAGRPLPPPRYEGSSLPDGNDEAEEVLSLPGTSKVEMLVPPLNYSAHLDAIRAMATELEDDLPELAEAIGVDKILFGSDWPHGEGLESPVSFAEELTAFSESDIRKIMRDNALDLLGVKATVAA